MSSLIPGSDLYGPPPSEVTAPPSKPDSGNSQAHFSQQNVSNAAGGGPSARRASTSELNPTTPQQAGSAPDGEALGLHYAPSNGGINPYAVTPPAATQTNEGQHFSGSAVQHQEGISATQLLGKSPVAATTTPTPGVAPRIEVKLFVGRLPRTIDETTLTPLFAAHGEVTETIIIRDKGTGMHKGSAFIKMSSITEADAAIRALHNTKVLDPQLGPIQVKYANGESERLGLPADPTQAGQDMGKLFVGSLPRGITEAQIRTMFEPYGQVDEVVSMKDPGTGQSRGCAFVKFAFKEQALYAIRSLHGQHTCQGCPRPLEVKFAENRRGAAQSPALAAAAAAGPAMGGAYGMLAAPGGVGPGGAASNLNPRTGGGWSEYFTADGRAYYHNEATKVTQWTKPADFDHYAGPPMMGGAMMAASAGGPAGLGASPPTGIANSTDVAGPPGANVFVFHIPNEWTQTEVIHHFSPYGRVISCFIATDRTTGRNKGYGFVSFANIEAAAGAVQGMNGFPVGSKRLKVSIKSGEEAYVAHLLGNANNPAGNVPAAASPSQPMAQPMPGNPYQRPMRPSYGMPGGGAVSPYGEPVYAPHGQALYGGGSPYGPPGGGPPGAAYMGGAPPYNAYRPVAPGLYGASLPAPGPYRASPY